MSDQPDRQDGDGLRAKLIAFDCFLNEPSSYEDKIMVRDYRHSAYANWSSLRADIVRLIDASATRDAAEGAKPRKLLDLPYLRTAAPQPAPDAVRLLERIRDFPHDDSASARGMAQLATDAMEALAAPVPPADGAANAMNEALARQYDIPDELWKGATKDNPMVPPSATGAAEPVAWTYEAGTRILNDGSGNYCGWREQLTKDKPNAPEKSIRNLRPLYATPPVRGDREEIARIIDPLPFAKLKELDDRGALPNVRGRSAWKARANTALGVADALIAAGLVVPVQPGAGEREAAIEECARLIEQFEFPAPRKNHRYQFDVKYKIVALIRALSHQPPQFSSEE